MGIFDTIKKAVSKVGEVAKKTAQTIIPGGSKGFLEPSKPTVTTETGRKIELPSSQPEERKPFFSVEGQKQRLEGVASSQEGQFIKNIAVLGGGASPSAITGVASKVGQVFTRGNTAPTGTIAKTLKETNLQKLKSAFPTATKSQLNKAIGKVESLKVDEMAKFLSEKPKGISKAIKIGLGAGGLGLVYKIADTDTLTTWYALDNAASGMPFKIDNIRKGIESGSMTVDEANEEFTEMENIYELALKKVNTSARWNPLLFPGRTTLVRGAESDLSNYNIKKETLLNDLATGQLVPGQNEGDQIRQAQLLRDLERGFTTPEEYLQLGGDPNAISNIPESLLQGSSSSGGGGFGGFSSGGSSSGNGFTPSQSSTSASKQFPSKSSLGFGLLGSSGVQEKGKGGSTGNGTGDSGSTGNEVNTINVDGEDIEVGSNFIRLKDGNRIKRNFVEKRTEPFEKSTEGSKTKENAIRISKELIENIKLFEEQKRRGLSTNDSPIGSGGSELAIKIGKDKLSKYLSGTIGRIDFDVGSNQAISAEDMIRALPLTEQEINDILRTDFTPSEEQQKINDRIFELTKIIDGISSRSRTGGDFERRQKAIRERDKLKLEL